MAAVAIDCATGEETSYTPPPLSLEERKTVMQDAIRSRRQQAELSGAVVGGVPVRSDEGSQRKIAGAVQLFEKDGTLTAIDFEAQPGIWVTLDQATMEAIGVAVGRHIQACFSNARALSEAVDAAEDNDALDLIDMEAGWP